MEIIIRQDGTRLGRKRSEHEENLRKEWGPTMTDEQLDKIKHLEKKGEDVFGSKDSFFHPIDADNLAK